MIPAFKALSVPKWSGSIDGREYTNRDRVGAHEWLVVDYFVARPNYKAGKFRRRFRMRRAFFNRILEVITNFDLYFKPSCDALGLPGVSGLVKMTATIQMFAYGCPADSMDYLIKLVESTTRESLHHFCNAVVNYFEEQYLRSLMEEYVTRLLAVGEERSCPELIWAMLARKATAILEAVVDQELWFWHTYFGMAGSSNDLNVLDNSHLVRGTATSCVYQVNNNPYNIGYYLTDGIYRPWATLIQTISFPASPMDINFAKAQELARKDVERGFGILQARFAIVSRHARQWDRRALFRIMKTCIILHNMIVENKHYEQLPTWKPPSDE